MRSGPAALLAAHALLRGAPEAVLTLCLSDGEPFDAEPGERLASAGTCDTRLLLLFEGRIELRLPGAGDGLRVGVVEAGGTLGGVQAVTGAPAKADAVATRPCRGLALDRPLQHRLAAAFPDFGLRLAQQATQALRALVFRSAVAALVPGLQAEVLDELASRGSEVLLDRGAVLMRAGEPADAWYVLTSGRLGVSTPGPDGPRRSADLLPGASVGEIGLIAGGVRSATVVAERDASLVRLGRDDFERLAERHPGFARRLMGTVVQRLVDQASARPPRGAEVLVVLRADEGPALAGALRELAEALRQTAHAALCTRAGFEAAVGDRIDAAAEQVRTHPLWGRFDLWLADAQNGADLVLLDAGAADGAWARECLLHADRCLWLTTPADAAAAGPPPAARERLRRAQHLARGGQLPWTLLVAHPPDADRPRNTRAWLEAAPFERHVHLRAGDRPSIERCARLLAGRANGLALSGGGARGFAHIGVLHALREAGVPIDVIGGTSMGAIQAAHHAMGLDRDAAVALTRWVVGQRLFREYTLPLVALTGSRRRDHCTEVCYGDWNVEDLWLPYLSVSTDLHAAQPVVHERGPLGIAVAASSSIPGLLVPVTDGTRVMVDGGVVNNLPADLVKARCGGLVFASKVAPSDDVRPPPGGFPSPWSLLAHRLLPWRRPLDAPGIADLLVRTMTVGGEDHMRRVLREVDVLIEPAVDRFGMMQFGAIDALVAEGERATRERLRAWRSSGR